MLMNVNVRGTYSYHYAVKCQEPCWNSRNRYTSSCGHQFLSSKAMNRVCWKNVQRLQQGEFCVNANRGRAEQRIATVRENVKLVELFHVSILLEGLSWNCFQPCHCNHITFELQLLE